MYFEVVVILLWFNGNWMDSRNSDFEGGNTIAWCIM